MALREQVTLPGMVSELHATCGSALRGEEAMLVGRLLDLAACAGAPANTVITPGFDEPLLREWLGSGASLSVASALLGPEAGYMLSRGQEGAAMATVVAEGLADEFSCFGETDAIALCGAICAALARSLAEYAASTPSTALH
ncbi:MAG: hypothetical protein RLZZ08_1114 [Pseudomonadota bacterium]|jgi:hypothetical protein